MDRRIIVNSPWREGEPCIPCHNVQTTLHYVESDPEDHLWTPYSTSMRSKWYVVRAP